MTVQQAIDELQKIDDKGKSIKQWDYISHKWIPITEFIPLKLTLENENIITVFSKR